MDDAHTCWNGKNKVNKKKNEEKLQTLKQQQSEMDEWIRWNGEKEREKKKSYHIITSLNWNEIPLNNGVYSTFALI